MIDKNLFVFFYLWFYPISPFIYFNVYSIYSWYLISINYLFESGQILNSIAVILDFYNPFCLVFLWLVLLKGAMHERDHKQFSTFQQSICFCFKYGQMLFKENRVKKEFYSPFIILEKMIFLLNLVKIIYLCKTLNWYLRIHIKYSYNESNYTGADLASHIRWIYMYL